MNASDGRIVRTDDKPDDFIAADFTPDSRSVWILRERFPTNYELEIRRSDTFELIEMIKLPWKHLPYSPLDDGRRVGAVCAASATVFGLHRYIAGEAVVIKPARPQ